MRPINGTCYSCGKKIDTGPYGIRRYCDRYCPDRQALNRRFARMADVIDTWSKTLIDSLSPALQALNDALRPLSNYGIAIDENLSITARQFDKTINFGTTYGIPASQLVQRESGDMEDTATT